MLQRRSDVLIIVAYCRWAYEAKANKYQREKVRLSLEALHSFMSVFRIPCHQPQHILFPTLRPESGGGSVRPR
jgi:hypothetical protein